MTLEFNENGVQTSTYNELFTRLDDGYKAIYGSDIDTDQESPDGQKIGIDATARFDIESALSWLYSNLDPDFNTGDMQQVIGKLSATYLLPSSRSQWDLEITTDRVLTLPANYTISDQNNQDWFLEQDVPLVLGTNSVTFKSSLWGDISGVSTGSSFTQLTPELGVLSISTTVNSVNGREEETEEQFRVRRKRSAENPSQSSIGAIYAKLAQLPGVIDLAVYDNGTNTANIISGSSNGAISNPSVNLPPHTLWVIIEGGELADIGEVMAKQRLGNSKGSIEVTYTDELIKPNGDPLYIVNAANIDRPDYVDLYVNITVKEKVSGSPIDAQAIKDLLASKVFEIGSPTQASELYANAYIVNSNYIAYDLEISIDGITYTDEQLSPGYDGKFVLTNSNIVVTVINV